MLIDELKLKYPDRTFLQSHPKADCKRCHGTGEKPARGRDELTPCICLYIDHDACDEIGDLLSTWAKQQREKLESPS